MIDWWFKKINMANMNAVKWWKYKNLKNQICQIIINLRNIWVKEGDSKIIILPSPSLTHILLPHNLNGEIGRNLGRGCKAQPSRIYKQNGEF